MEYIKTKFKKSVNFPATIRSIGWIMKHFQFTAIDLTEIYEGTFNKTRYLLCWFHFLLVGLGFLQAFGIVNWNKCYEWIIDENFPNNVKQLIQLGMRLIVLSQVMRYDHLDGQRKSGLSFYKIFYSLQHDIKSEHQLTDENYKRLSLYSQLIDWIYLKIGSFLMISITSISTLYIAVVCNKIGFKLISPLCLYFIFIGSIPNSVTPLLVGITIYYYKLRFDQINHEIKSICGGNDFIPFHDQIKLIILIKKHN